MAGAMGVDPMILDLDYVLGVFLGEWYREAATQALRFKGGTCLRKCYFSEHRFSRDLDFTAEVELSEGEIDAMLDQVLLRIQEKFGLNLSERERRKRVIQDQRGGSTMEIRLYYRGPLRRTGAPQTVQLHITTLTSEYLFPNKGEKRILHPYSDQAVLEDVNVPCYTLQEILSEKLRAICGQRRFAISRDVYDIHKVLKFEPIELGEIQGPLKQKFAARNIKIKDIRMGDFASRKVEFERDWHRDLIHLLPIAETTTFDEAWHTTLTAVSWVESLSK